MKKWKLLLAFLFTMGMFVVHAQTTVNGTVLDAEGKPVPGANVRVKGFNDIGTISDLNGSYSLSVPDGATTLVFSFVGMKTQEIEIGGKTTINVSLKNEDVGIDEVVVVGYGSQIKADMTGSILKVDGKEINELPVPTFESALQGKTAGVFIASTSGKLGEGMNVRIRGASSISADNQPLYVIDGVVVTSQSQTTGSNSPTNPMVDINPNDIESVTILKDAAGAAIYGSRASNGVIIITTKQGKQGKTKIDVGYQYGVSDPANKMEFMDGPQYYQFFHDIFANSYGEADADDWGEYFVPGFTSGNNSNWQDEAFQKGGIQQLNFSASGGDEKTQFYVGLTYNEQKGILLGNTLNRFSGRVNVSHKAYDRFKVGMNLGISNSDGSRVSNDNAFATPLQMIALPPVQATHDPVTGELNTNTIYYNGLIENRDSQDKTGVFRNIGNVYAELDIYNDLKFKTTYGLDLLNQREDTYNGRLTQDGAPDGIALSRAVQVIRTSFENYFTYNKDLANDINLNAVLGMAYENSNTLVTSVQAKGFPSDDFKTIASASEATTFYSSETNFSYVSYFLRANANFMHRYIFGASVRVDGSSRFGENSKYGMFPAASAGWIITNESFVAQSDVLSFLKLRTSYGLTGNSEIGNFPSMGLYTGSPYGSVPGVRPAQIASPDLRWETTAQFNFGLDFALFDNRVSAEMDYYIKKTNDLLLSKPLPATSGFVSYVENIGKLENKGFEFVLNTQNIVGNFNWSTSLNMSFNKNEITDLNGEPINSGYNRAEEGKEVAFFYMRKYAGVDPDNGDALYYINSKSDATTNDYNEAEKQFVGSPNPDFVGGFTNTFAYAGFDFQFLFQFVYGNEIYRNGGHWQSSNGWNMDNQTVDQLDAWKNPGDITDVPRADWDVNNGTRASSRYLEDGSYMRLKSVSLGYNLSSSFTQRLKMRNVRVYVTGVNLYTWATYTGMDPEVSFQGTNRSQTSLNLQQGVDFYTTPQARTITFGINIGI